MSVPYTLTVKSCTRSPSASANSMMIEYASSPEEQPALQTRMDRVSSAFSMMPGTISSARKRHAAGSRKNVVTLIRMLLKSSTRSPGWVVR